MSENIESIDKNKRLQKLRENLSKPLLPQLSASQMIESIKEDSSIGLESPQPTPEIKSMIELISDKALQMSSSVCIRFREPKSIGDRIIQSTADKIAAISREPGPKPNISLLANLIQEQTDQIISRVYFQDVGTVQRVGNGVARLSGLQRVSTDELVTFPTGVHGLVLNLDRGHVDVILLGPDEGIRGGDLVTATGKRLRIPVGPKLLGRIVNSLGEPLDGQGTIEAAAFHYLEREAPGIIDRAPVNIPLHTGIKILDALIPIGRGQRELIIGNRQTGKTAIAIDTILNQQDSNVNCIYVAIGQKKSSTLSVIETLRNAGALKYTTVVVSSPDDPPALRYLGPYAGCTIAEYLVHQMNRDVLIVYDNLSKHADAYRELSLLLRRPPGREAYPGDIFYLHSRLLERACKLNENSGGGSLTALPIIEMQRGNISAYIPTNLISICDGQIVLDSDLFNQGIKPAVDVGRSVSRVGGAAQTPAMRSVTGKLRLELAQFEEVARFARFGTEVDEAIRHQIERGKRLQTILNQPISQPLSLSHQVISLMAATEGFLDDVAVEHINEFINGLLTYSKEVLINELNQINSSGELPANMRSLIRNKLKSYHDEWLNGRTSK